MSFKGHPSSVNRFSKIYQVFGNLGFFVRVDNINNYLCDRRLALNEKTNLNICDVSIADITDQYINYINVMEELDLDVASEFLVMGATLLQIKSQSLLPAPKAN